MSAADEREVLVKILDDALGWDRRYAELTDVADALIAAGYGLRQVPGVEDVKAWALKEFGVSNGTQVWIEFQGDPDKFATAVLALMKGEK